MNSLSPREFWQSFNMSKSDINHVCGSGQTAKLADTWSIVPQACRGDHSADERLRDAAWPTVALRAGRGAGMGLCFQNLTAFLICSLVGGEAVRNQY